MDKFDPNLIGLLITVTGLGLIPVIVVTTTAFLKVSVVMFLLRNALGIQQSPPNIVLYGIALILTVYISAPVLGDIYARVNEPSVNFRTAEGLQAAAQQVRVPLHDFLARFTQPQERDFFLAGTARIWPEKAQAAASPDDLMVLVPSFMVSELTRAFKIGFLLYLPFIIIDLVVSNILMAMGMIMVSPLVISVPFKLLLFVLVDGWSRLVHGLILSYSTS